MQGFLVALCMAILEKILTKGTVAFDKYLELRKELDENKSKADEYEKLVKSGASRAERRNAEDNIFS